MHARVLESGAAIVLFVASAVGAVAGTGNREGQRSAAGDLIGRGRGTAVEQGHGAVWRGRPARHGPGIGLEAAGTATERKRSTGGGPGHGGGAGGCRGGG